MERSSYLVTYMEFQLILDHPTTFPDLNLASQCYEIISFSSSGDSPEVRQRSFVALRMTTRGFVMLSTAKGDKQPVRSLDRCPRGIVERTYLQMSPFMEV